jgi:hypothetical protein
MIQEAIYFWMSSVTFVAALVAVIFISIYRKYERENLVNGINFMMIAIILIMVVAFINMLKFSSVSYSITLNALLPGVHNFVPLLESMKNLIIYPIMAVMFLVSAIIFRR